MKGIERVPREHHYCLKEKWEQVNVQKGSHESTTALSNKKRWSTMKGIEITQGSHEKYRKNPKGALLPKGKVENNESHRKGPKGALLSKSKVVCREGFIFLPCNN